MSISANQFKRLSGFWALQGSILGPRRSGVKDFFSVDEGHERFHLIEERRIEFAFEAQKDWLSLQRKMKADLREELCDT